jgi:hypothetical protein
MDLVENLRARLRTLLRRRVERQIPPRTPKPRVGATVVHVRKGIRMLAQAGISDELWKWMMDRGWRIESHRPDRRDYLEVPGSYVTRLIDSHPSRWRRAILDAIENARPKTDWSKTKPEKPKPDK